MSSKMVNKKEKRLKTCNWNDYQGTLMMVKEINKRFLNLSMVIL